MLIKSVVISMMPKFLILNTYRPASGRSEKDPIIENKLKAKKKKLHHDFLH